MTGLDVLTLLLSIAGCWGLATCRIARIRYSERRPTRGYWGVILAAVIVRLVFSEGTLGEDLLVLARDLGIGVVIASVPLKSREGRPASWLVLGVVLLLLWGVSGLSVFGTDWREILVELGPDDQVAEVEAILERHDAEWEQAFPNVTLAEDPDLSQVYLVRCPADQVASLMAALGADHENVDGVELNEEMSAVPILDGTVQAGSGRAVGANDPRLGDQWALDRIDAHEALALLRQESAREIALVAIVDTGVDSDHEDLEAIFSPSPGDLDGHGHGTHCAGIAGAATNNGVGIASLNWEGRFVRIRGYQALNEHGTGTTESIAQAIIDAAEDGADVISLSLGGYHPTPPQVQVDAIEYALGRGAIVVAAAGNSAEAARLHAPANIPGVIVVTAVDREGRRARFSNTVEGLQRPIAAPGVDILSLAPGGGYVAYSGTSMATPLVAGLIGVMRALRPELTVSEVYGLLQRSGQNGADASLVGRTINAHSAIRELLR